ncbi:MAG: polysaccharide deacetylase family protein [Candidatus Nanopelagicales bacterium]
MRFTREIVGVGAAALALLLAACGTAAQADQENSVAQQNSESAATAKPKPKASVQPTPVPSVKASWSPASGDKTIYLTFDDGPGPYTQKVLDVLKDNDVKATFFIIGKMIRTREADLQRVYDDGHATGDHTWDHADLSRMNAVQIDRQLNKAAVAIGPKMGPCMRPPYGALDAEARKLAVSYGMTPVLWTRDTNDWNKASQTQIYNVLMGAKPGDVILMHDGGGDRANTVAALRDALPKLKDKGYSFASVPVCVSHTTQ